MPPTWREKMLDAKKIRKDFPVFDTGIIYLDSAATSQKPRQVIEAVSNFYKTKNSNVARGLYRIAEEATMAYESVRKKAASFINAREAGEIIFTRNTTEGANLVMRGWGEKNMGKGGKVATTMLEHHTNFVPWQVLAKRKGAEFAVAEITDEGLLDEADLEQKIRGASLVAVSAASNVLGTMPDTKKICRIAHDNGALCFVDAAQYAPSIPVNVKEMGCDFLAFSGHKMLAPFGAGVLYGRHDILEDMDPLLYGSEMIREVHPDHSEWAEIPHKFEAGTPAVDAVVGLGAAMDYLSSAGLENIRNHEMELVKLMLERLSEIKGLEILGPEDPGRRGALVAFTVEGVHPHDISAMLSEDNVCVRSGHHCAMPLHTRLGVAASTRASVYLYNTKEDIDALAESLHKVEKLFK
ncbi:SufS family cysteine desulfurase [Candidatus Micrarchaeota archaeon]|nr:SufS family cysteine desulfurase [Candidatus Micrarchaeota archaeon]